MLRCICNRSSRVAGKGTGQSKTQALDWPRSDVIDFDGYLVDNDSLPDSLVKACAELAYLSVTETDGLWKNLETPGTIIKKRVKAGPVESDTTYGAASQYKRFPRVDALLSPYLMQSGLMTRG